MRPSRSPRKPQGRAAVPCLFPLARIAASGELARIRYRTADGKVSKRDVAVLGFGWRTDGWIFSAHCLTSAAHKLFRVDRVLDVESTGQPAPPLPPRFASRTFATTDLVDPPNAPTRRVSVRLAASVAPLASVLFPFALVEPSRYVPPSQLPLFAAEHSIAYAEPDPQLELAIPPPSSWQRDVVCHFRTTSLDRAAAMVASLGEVASATGPADFVVLVASMVRAAAAPVAG